MLWRLWRMASYALAMALGAALTLGAVSYGVSANGAVSQLRATLQPTTRQVDGIPIAEGLVPSELMPFYLAGLPVTPLDPATDSLPCVVRDVDNVALTAFKGPTDGDHFCLLRFPDVLTLTEVLRAHPSQHGERLTRRGPLLLVYLGYSPAVAYRYETVFMTLP